MVSQECHCVVGILKDKGKKKTMLDGEKKEATPVKTQKRFTFFLTFVCKLSGSSKRFITTAVRRQQHPGRQKKPIKQTTALGGSVECQHKVHKVSSQKTSRRGHHGCVWVQRGEGGGVWRKEARAGQKE